MTYPSRGHGVSVPAPGMLPKALKTGLMMLAARLMHDQISEPEALDILEAVALNAPKQAPAGS